ncbi:MAG: hypothetical protein EHM70_03660 [Chloroflexota bacterium]|nr:MAG: hypothetical protein EHM70_03660 [Chloroflexota bacterium]
MERYVRDQLSQPCQSNNFADLEKELYIIATNLDNGDRVIFGDKEDQHEIPISLAVAASSALPMLYKPVRIGEKEYVDGGLRGTASIDLAIEEGASLVVVINPLVPFDNQLRDYIPYLDPEEGHLSKKGVRAVADQALRILSHSGLQYHIKQISRSHPEVDIILIEPRRDDYQMFQNNIMRYSARLVIAQHGFESVTLDLAEDYPRYKSILSRHGIKMTRRLVIEELAEIQSSGYDPDVIRSVLEARSSACTGARRNSQVCKLSRSLDDLIDLLDEKH